VIVGKGRSKYPQFGGEEGGRRILRRDQTSLTYRMALGGEKPTDA